MNDSIIQALTVPFAAGFVVQRFLEVFDPLTSKLFGDANTKKIALKIASLLLGWAIAAVLPVAIFHTLMNVPVPNDPGFLTYFDYFLSGVFVSAGTEGFNTLLKFGNYKKEASKADAANKLKSADPDD